MRKVVINIKELVGVSTIEKRFAAGADMQQLETIEDAYLAFDEDTIIALAP